MKKTRVLSLMSFDYELSEFGDGVIEYKHVFQIKLEGAVLKSNHVQSDVEVEVKGKNEVEPKDVYDKIEAGLQVIT